MSQFAYFFPWFFTRNWLWGEWFHFNESGQVGDTIGGIISPFIAILAAWLTYKAFIIQYEANEQLKQDSKIASFENTFFQMLQMQQMIINNLFLRGIFYTRDARSPLRELKGREIFSFLYEMVDDDKMQFLNGSSIQGGIKDNIAQYGVDYFSKTDNLSFLDHYFKHLYRIVQFVDDATFLENRAKKYEYLCILRAQLSDYELGLLFYNCLSDNGKDKFKPLIERYALFNNLRNKVLNNPDKDRLLYANGAYKFIDKTNENPSNRRLQLQQRRSGNGVFQYRLFVRGTRT